ncbi:MAG: polyprenol monophosphomannose synthase [Bacteroidales bacterium]|nr:polyprenol monophosphomannose synthase [Bacteroidales bacterium]MCF8336315.1 polyprenol monophosphomannose synthase [Bacteroidales bacterium]
MDKNLVIIPTYKEKENIDRIIEKIFSLNVVFHILVVDDNSPDGTSRIVKELQKKYREQLFLIERKGKLGLGTAYITGFKWAIHHGYDYIYEMDADFSHNPEDLPRLYNACAYDGADVAIGSRYKNGANVVHWPIGRILISYFASRYVAFITGMKIKDPTAGFVCYRRKVLETINLNKIKMVGYAFQIEMKFAAWKYGFKLVEIPIIFTNRAVGTSKMSGGIFNEAVWGVISIKIRSIFKKYKKYEPHSNT